MPPAAVDEYAVIVTDLLGKSIGLFASVAEAFDDSLNKCYATAFPAYYSYIIDTFRLIALLVL